MANELTMDDVRRMQELEAELMRLRALQEALSPEERAMLFEDSDMDEAMRYAEQDRDMRRRAEQGDAMARTLVRGEDPPSPQEMDPPLMITEREKAEMRALMGRPAPMRMDGMGAGPMPSSIREDVMKNLMAAEEPEEEL